MAVNSCEDVRLLSFLRPISALQGQGPYCISVSPDEGSTNTQFDTPLAFSGQSEIPNLTNGMCLVTELNCQSYINIEKQIAAAYSPCTVDVDIEKGNSGTPKSNEDVVLKIESSLPRALQRQNSLNIGEKFMQLLMNDSLVLPKSTIRDKSMTERVHEPNNRTRKYKRSASFNSRKVVLLFSVLSSVGTIILIYLTLRVRQIGDASVPVG